MEGKVIIAGGGPAGCSTAITIKKLMPELEVKLYEQRPQIGKVECGEAISKKAVEENYDILKNFFNKCVARRVDKFKIIMNEEEKEVYSPGFMIDRSLFNKGLIKEAGKVGCDVRTGHKVIPLGRVEGKWEVEVENRYNHKKYRGKCDMLVLAAGGSSRMAVAAGLVNEREYKNWMKDHVFGYQYKIKSPFKDEELLVDFTPNPSPELVYHYAFLHHSDITNFGLLHNHKFVTGRFYDTLLKEYLKKLGIKRYSLQGTPKGNYIPSSGPLPVTYGEGVLAVGDNAGFANPIFYGGIHSAISSGKIAGKIIVEAFEAKNFGKDFLKKYEDEWRKMPWGDPILIEGKKIHEKIRRKEKVSDEEMEIYSKALDITRVYGW